jgi:hypothetical protein
MLNTVCAVPTAHTVGSARAVFRCLTLQARLSAGMSCSRTLMSANDRAKRSSTARSATEAYSKPQLILLSASIRQAKLFLRIRRQLKLSGITFPK